MTAPPLSPQVDVAHLPPCVDQDCNCGDFRNQPLAQTVFDAFPQDIFNLDEDDNGVACEALPPTSADLDPVVPPSQNPHLQLGNPSHAGTRNPANYLLERSQYALSYNRDRGIANWVSWHLSRDWLGDTPRQDNFRQDGGLPAGMYQVTPEDYRDSGYDRGHTVPSGDRTRSVKDNASTFLMTNILPQSPENNQGVWRELEEYARALVAAGDRELLIIAGSYGTQGTLAQGRLTIPSRLWKIIVVLDPPNQGVRAISPHTQVIAVDIPNQAVPTTDWRLYQTTIDRIELATGYDFLSQVPEDIQAILEATSSVSLPQQTRR